MDSPPDENVSEWPVGSVFFVLMALIIAVLNFIVFVAIVRKRYLRDERFEQLEIVDVCLLSASAGDCIMGFVMVVTIGAAKGNFHTDRNGAACAVNFIASSGLVDIGIWSLCILAYTRYSLIINTQSIGLSWRNITVMLALAWVFPLAYVTIITALSERFPGASGLYCGPIPKEKYPAVEPVAGIWTLVRFAAPGIVTGYCYRKVSQVVQQSLHSDQRLLRRIITMCVALTMIYTLTYLPLLVVALFYSTSSLGSDDTFAFYRISPALDTALFFLALSNSLANPVAYLVFQKRVRRAVNDLFGMRFELSQSSTPRTPTSGKSKNPKNCHNHGGNAKDTSWMSESSLVKDIDTNLNHQGKVVCIPHKHDNQTGVDDTSCRSASEGRELEAAPEVSPEMHDMRKGDSDPVIALANGDNSTFASASEATGPGVAHDA